MFVHFIDVCNLLQLKAKNSAGVLVKTALHIRSNVWDLVGQAFATQEDDARKCYTRGALGCGIFWNTRNASLDLQMWWVQSIWQVHKTNRGIPFKNASGMF